MPYEYRKLSPKEREEIVATEADAVIRYMRPLIRFARQVFT